MKRVNILMLSILLGGIYAHAQLSFSRDLSIDYKKQFLDSCIAVTPEIKLPATGDELYSMEDFAFLKASYNPSDYENVDSLLNIDYSIHPYIPQELILQTDMSNIYYHNPLNYVKATGKMRVNDRLYLIGWTEHMYMLRIFLFDVTDTEKLYPDYIVILNESITYSYDDSNNIIHLFIENENGEKIIKEGEFDLNKGFISESQSRLQNITDIKDRSILFDPFPEMPFSQTSNIYDVTDSIFCVLPGSIRYLNGVKKYDLKTTVFQNIFLQNKNFDNEFIRKENKYSICGKYKIYDNLIYIVELSRNDEFDMYMACCFNPNFYYPQILKLYYKEPEDIKESFPTHRWTFRFDEETHSFNIICRYSMEYAIYDYSIYKITPSGFEPKIANQLLPIDELYISNKDLDLKRYGYYIDERDSVEIREVRTPWMKPEL